MSAEGTRPCSVCGADMSRKEIEEWAHENVSPIRGGNPPAIWGSPVCASCRQKGESQA